MKIPTRETNQKVVTVILGVEKSNELKNMHCMNCGRIVFNYYSDVRVIIPGEMREVTRPVDIFCSRCKIIYRIA